MQMRVGLQIRLSKQTEIKIRKKGKKKQKTVVSARKKNNVDFGHSQRGKHFWRIWRERLKVSILLRDYQHKLAMMWYRKASSFISIFSETLQVITDCIRIEIIWQMMDNPPEERPATIPLPLSPIIHVHVVSVSEIMITSDIFTFCEHRKCLKWQLGYRKTSFPSLALSCLQSFHVLSGELAFSQSHNHRDTDWRAD